MILHISNVWFRSLEESIIKNISLEIKEGDAISFVGPSGSGKSTLLRMCADLLSPTEGELYFKGKNYKEYEPTHLRKKISYCTQMPILFGKTVYDNLCLPYLVRNEKVNLTIIHELMTSFNINPHDIEKEIHLLSGGEKQRIALIRNLLFPPDILLLDEVTSALDSENAQVVEKYIHSLNEKGTTILWITHDLAQSKSFFNKRVTLLNGEISALEVF